ncbi:endonuclease/exonuclease/phosphatase family protein [Maribacter ulvicola]|uniref:Exonuclease III n=1 Tax=Maribacter ulvicola TaxID=228959 RepID=A0A1N6ZYD2_9FLAO|nr:endonuclease/exonuclease/phosphatase family protein [Maribacter ulvicola]SIR31850.1 Exonuclease III [Maribacter ulvicola]
MKSNIVTGIFFALYVILNSVSSYAQNNFYTSFDEDMESFYSKTALNDAVYITQLQRPQFIEGVKGKALDLSENAVLRMPLAIDSLKNLNYGQDKSLTVSIWVKTVKNAKQGTVIIGNKKENDLNSAGWMIFSQPSGAWGANISDGKHTYTYTPTIPRQAINDGVWHQLAFSVNREKEEIWFYLDGENVAIYNTPGIGAFNSEHRTVIGGTDEYWEYGSQGQWTAFNGFLDEVSIDAVYSDDKEIEAEYVKFRHTKVKKQLNAPIRTMVWNIWHGGRRYGKHVGVKRTIDIIKEARPDIIGLIETYGSGEIIADSLGYHFYLISSNLSIMSRFPIKETIKAFRPFNFGGVKVDLGNNKELMFLNTWLHYLPDYAAAVVHKEKSANELIKAEAETRHAEVKQILKEIKPILKNTDKTPVIMLGDFNSGSHLDWTDDTRQIHNDFIVEWPVSKTMQKNGFFDSYREMHIDPLLDPGFTWTPRAATSSKKYGLRDRIDFIYYKGGLNPIGSKVIDYHPIMFPSDHAAILTVFEVE